MNTTQRQRKRAGHRESCSRCSALTRSEQSGASGAAFEIRPETFDVARVHNLGRGLETGVRWVISRQKLLDFPKCLLRQGLRSSSAIRLPR